MTVLPVAHTHTHTHIYILGKLIIYEQKINDIIVVLYDNVRAIIVTNTSTVDARKYIQT